MEREAIKKLIMRNAANFPQFYTKTDDQLFTVQIDTWNTLFADYDNSIIEAYFMQALKTAQYPVKPADIFAIMTEQQKASMPTIDELFKIATDTADEMQDYRSQGRWESEYGAGKSGYEYALEIYNKMPPLLKEWKRSPDDLIAWYYGIDGDGNNFDRRDFEKSINSILERRQLNGIAWNEEVKSLFDGNTFKLIADKKQIGGGN